MTTPPNKNNVLP